jgi:hypothetical protein
MMPLGATADGPSFVFLNLGHWDLFEIWYLVLGIFVKQIVFAKLVIYRDRSLGHRLES